MKWLLWGKAAIEAVEALPIAAPAAMIVLGIIAGIEKISGPNVAPVSLLVVCGLGALFAKCALTRRCHSS